jgi:uncharacterized protein with PIN domain
MPRSITIRFYEELNDFLPRERRRKSFTHCFYGTPSVKDVIESLGVPHVEIDMILANSQSVSFDYRPEDGDYISVYPVFESLDISTETRLRPKPLRTIRFILDVHLGKLARYLRMLGFDTMYDTGYDDNEIIARAVKQNRIILTRDILLLKHSKVTHGLWIRSQDPIKQLKEVIQRLDLSKKFKPFHRCMDCNAPLVKTGKEEVMGKVRPNTLNFFNAFYRCMGCGKIYWNGSHFERMQQFVNQLNHVSDPMKY